MAERFYSFSLDTTAGRAVIGISSPELGPRPELVILAQGSRALVGYATSVAAIDLASMSVIQAIVLGGVFFTFLSLAREDEVILIHEIGALRVAASGEVRWRYCADDIVTDWRLDEAGILALTLMEEPTLVNIASDSGLSLPPEPHAP